MTAPACSGPIARGYTTSQGPHSNILWVARAPLSGP